MPTERGSSSVELALVIPLALVMALALVQVGLLAKDALVVAQAAREGAREAAVTLDGDEVRRAAVGAGGLHGDRMHVEIARSGSVGDPVTVTIRYRAAVVVPLVSWLLPHEVELDASATMRQEVGSGTYP